MTRIIVTVNDEMAADLKEEADRRGATLSGLARLYLAQGLSAATSKPMDRYRVAPGGPRRAELRQKQEAIARWTNEGGQGPNGH